MNKGILNNCRTKLRLGNSYTEIINYLFTMDIEEQEILEIFKTMGIGKDEIKDILIYKFGLDNEIIMSL